MMRALARRMVRWGVIALLLHSAILLFIAPSAFMYYGDGFVLGHSEAFVAHRILDGAVKGVVSSIANNYIPHSVYWWLGERFPSIDEVSFIAQTSLYLVVGGAFYFVVGTFLWFLVSIRGMWRARPDGHRSGTAVVSHTS